MSLGAISRPVEDDGYPVARSEDLRPRVRCVTQLFGQDISVWRDARGELHGAFGTDRARLAARGAYGLVWVTRKGIVDLPCFPEGEDGAFRSVVCGPYGVATSAPRIIENFLDMAHFPFVHEGFLGLEPHTEVREYEVDETADGGLLATGCAFWQPQTRVLGHEGALVHYEYRVLRPYSAVLAKLPESAGAHRVAILLSVQPVEAERSICWIVFATTNRAPSDLEIRSHQERIFLQDKPILENQRPKRLPLDQRAEMSLSADRLSAAYRRFLHASDVGFGVTPR